MNKYIAIIIALIVLFAATIWYLLAASQPGAPGLANKEKMSFFVTSKNLGQGANFGGLAGADNHCQVLAQEAGVEGKTWRAYLSASAFGSTPAVNARDRIGNGPWVNFNGVVIADNIEGLHNINNINKQTALTEKGGIVNGRGDTPNIHDILTGSDPEGRAIPGADDTTCRNWISGSDGAAMVGHHDRIGLADDAPSKSWNSSHLSRGCSLEALASSGGGGLLYCFVAN